MQELSVIKVFEDQDIRVVWDDEEEKFFFSIVDVIHVLTDQADHRAAAKYWSVLKVRLKAEGSEVPTNCSQLKLLAPDGKLRLTDVVDTEQLLRLIQSIPSKKAEPFKLWLAEVGRQRIDQLQDPELHIDQMIADYHRKGYSDGWINQRIKTIEIRNGLTNEWHRSGIHEDRDFAVLTDIISKAWSGMTTREYKNHKGLRKESLRDNMTNVELMLSGLAEAAATELSQQENPQGLTESKQVAKRGGKVAHVARKQLEKELGHTVITEKKAIDYIHPIDELDFPKEDAKNTPRLKPHTK